MRDLVSPRAVNFKEAVLLPSLLGGTRARKLQQPPYKGFWVANMKQEEQHLGSQCLKGLAVKPRHKGRCQEAGNAPKLRAIAFFIEMV